MFLTQHDLHAIRLSLQVSGLALAIFLAPGVLLGIWLGTGQSRSRSIVSFLLSLPLVLPPVVTGLLLLKLLIFLKLPLVFTWWAAGVATAVIASPLLVRTVHAGVESLDPRWYRVAATLGASRFHMLRTIVLPLSWRAIAAGTALFWARAMGEFGAVMVVAGNTPGQTQTIPLAIYSKLESASDRSIWPLVAVAVGISVVVVVISERLRIRGRLWAGANAAP